MNLKSKSLLTLMIMILPLLALSQAKAEFKISDISVELNNQAQSVSDEVFEVELLEDVERSFTIYSDGDLKFVATFKYARSGKRIKLVRTSYVQKGINKPVTSKKKKDVQFISVGVPGNINKQFSETLLIDKESMQSIFVNFKYVFNYK